MLTVSDDTARGVASVIEMTAGNEAIVIATATATDGAKLAAIDATVIEATATTATATVTEIGGAKVVATARSDAVTTMASATANARRNGGVRPIALRRLPRKRS